MSNDEVRAVRRMVEELRAEPTPELPWEAMEAKLFERIEQRAGAPELASSPRGSSSAPSPPSMLGRAFAIAAAAAAIALAIGTASTSGDMPRADATRHHVDLTALAPGAAGEPGVRDIAALHVGDIVEAGDAPVTFAQAGLVRWTLTAGSSARVSTVGFGHTLELERGSIRAEVVPRAPSEGMVEAFAVEVDGTRVAVHGTAFSVRRDETRVIVDVEHGAVTVGPRGHRGTTTGRLLVGPSRGSFSLDGGSSAQLLDREGAEPLVPVEQAHARTTTASADPRLITVQGAPPAELPPVAVTSAVSTAPLSATASGSAASPVSGAPGASGPTASAGSPGSIKAIEAPSEARLSAEVVRGRVERCVRGVFDARSSALESVSSTLSIDLNADGTVRAARFDPPLNPEMTACAGSAIGGRFASDTGRLAIPISIHR